MEANKGLRYIYKLAYLKVKNIAVIRLLQFWVQNFRNDALCVKLSEEQKETKFRKH